MSIECQVIVWLSTNWAADQHREIRQHARDASCCSWSENWNQLHTLVFFAHQTWNESFMSAITGRWKKIVEICPTSNGYCCPARFLHSMNNSIQLQVSASQQQRMFMFSHTHIVVGVSVAWLCRRHKFVRFSLLATLRSTNEDDSMEITTIRLSSIRRLVITNSHSSSARIVTNTNGLMSPLNPPSSSRTLHSTTQSNCVKFLIEKIVLVASCKL